jgi:uncharacterized ferredoxin-like protein
MEQMEWVTHSLIQEGLARSTTESEDKQIHEHQFVSTRLKGVNQLGVCCLTCGDCYCESCGKLLENGTIC